MSEDQMVTQIGVTLALVIASALGPERFMIAWVAWANFIRKVFGYRP